MLDGVEVIRAVLARYGAGDSHRQNLAIDWHRAYPWPLARDQFLAAAGERGWPVDRVQDSETFCRLFVHGPEDLLVDLALDSAPGRPSSASIAGPTFAPDELVGRKVIALFDRAAARDFVDVHALSRRFTKPELLELAREIDSGFDTRVFIDMLKQLHRYRDVDLALGEVDIPALRAFFQQWITELDLSDR